MGSAEASWLHGAGVTLPLALRCWTGSVARILALCLLMPEREREMETEFVEEIDKSSFIFANPKETQDTG